MILLLASCVHFRKKKCTFNSKFGRSQENLMKKKMRNKCSASLFVWLGTFLNMLMFIFFPTADKCWTDFPKIGRSVSFSQLSLFFLVCNSLVGDPSRGNSVKVAVLQEFYELFFYVCVCFFLLFKNFPLVHQLVTNWFCVKTNNNDSFETATTRWYGERSVKRKQSRWWWTGWK